MNDSSRFVFLKGFLLSKGIYEFPARVVLIILCLAAFSNVWAKKCQGRFINPVTDICWDCMLPITIGPVPNLSKQIDTKNPSNPICMCHRPPAPAPLPGIVGGFWEPVRLVDVTRKAWCMVGLGGVSMGSSMKKQGDIAISDNTQESSFWHVHYYVYPLVYWLELLTDFACMEMASFDVAYMSELDPSHNNDELNAVMNPEAALFQHPIMQAATAVDCVTASVGFPIDKMIYSAGCQGSMYPLTGFVDSHSSYPEAALLETQRVQAKLHRLGISPLTSGKKALCEKKVQLTIKKSQYKTQFVYPKAHTNSRTACNPFGRTSVFYASGFQFPYKGEDFAILIWRKRNCCIL